MTEPEFDVFICYASKDLAEAKKLARLLLDQGLKPWLDKWDLVGGNPWDLAIYAALPRCAACAVLIGPGGIGPWQAKEMSAATRRQVKEPTFRVIPVLLPGAARLDQSPLPDPLDGLECIEFVTGMVKWKEMSLGAGSVCCASAAPSCATRRLSCSSSRRASQRSCSRPRSSGSARSARVRK